MDSLTLSSSSPIQFFSHTLFPARVSTTLIIPCRKPRKRTVLASKNESNLDEWDRMELKFGRMIGEDPEVTMAKIMGKKLYPDLSYLEIEKLLEKRKGKPLHEGVEEVPFSVTDRKRAANSAQGLNLVRPVPPKGGKFEATRQSVKTDAKISGLQTAQPQHTKGSKSTVPDVALRKPGRFVEDDGSVFSLRPNLSFKIRKDEQKETYSDVSLLKKPELLNIRPDSEESNDILGSNSDKDGVSEDTRVQTQNESESNVWQIPPLMKPSFRSETKQESSSGSNIGLVAAHESDKGSETELQTNSLATEMTFASAVPSSSSSPPMDTLLIGKPKRLDPLGIPTEQKNRDAPKNFKSLEYPVELQKFVATSPIKEREDGDWIRAEELFKTGGREEVELISSSTRGFVASFDSLIGFLPYRNLAARWRFLAFESWLRRKGLDPSNYRQSLWVIGKYDATGLMDHLESEEDKETAENPDGKIAPNMKLEELLMIYDQEKIKFLSSFVGQKIKVGIVLANRSSRKLIFSIKPKEKEELIEKKRALMAQLSVGDILKCCITKITYFGIFVEIQGVPALIHQSEVSWDSTLDPTSYFQVGQIVEAKVHQLDFALERIFLSLKEVTPDPLMEALEAVIGDKTSLDGRLEEAEADAEWTEVDSLARELEQFNGIKSVSKGRYFLSPGLVPTFQVYMGSMVENEYKLLARSGNRVQEVFVQTSLTKEELKSAILICTNRLK